MQPGDCIILNAANSTVGQLIIQLCHLLQLRCVAVVREREQATGGVAQCADRLKSLGATHVLLDKGSLKVCSNPQRRVGQPCVCACFSIAAERTAVMAAQSAIGMVEVQWSQSAV